MKDRFTSIFDGTDISISNTKNKRMSKLLFCASKYNHCCVKIMIASSFTGLIVHYSGAHIGTSHDAK